MDRSARNAFELNEDDLMRRAAGGDDRAFQSLVMCHADRAWRVARRLVGDAQQAEAAVHEACVTARVELPLLTRTEGFGPWFLHLVVEAGLRRGEGEHSPSSDGVRAALERALHELPVRDRLAFVLHDQESLSWEEIGWLLEEPRGAVMRRVHRARLGLVPVVQALPQEASAPPRLRVVGS